MGNILLIIYYLIYLIAVLSVGSVVLRFFDVKCGSKIEEKVFGFALGNLIYSYIFIYLGIFHLLYAQILLGFYIIPTLFFIKQNFRKKVRIDFISYVKEFFTHRFELIEIMVFLFLFFIFLPLIPYLFTFPTSWDAIAYHLLLPKIYLRDHFFSFYNWLQNTATPIGMESIFGFGEVVRDPRLANFINFSFIAGIVVYMLYGLRYLFPRYVLFLALILFSFRHILFGEVSISPFVDFPFAFYGLVFAIIFMKYIKDHQFKLLALLLILSSFTFMIKYILGFLFIGAFLVALSINIFFNRKKILKNFLLLTKHKRLILFSVVLIFLIPIFYWFVKNYVYFQNPVHPFFNDIFKGLDYEKAYFQSNMSEMRAGSLEFWMLANLLLQVPVPNMSVLYEALFTLVMIIFSIFGLFMKERSIRYIALFGLLYSFVVFAMAGVPSYRYVLAVAPILFIVTSFVFFNFLRNFKLWKTPLIALLVWSLLVQASSALYDDYVFTVNNFKNGIRSTINYNYARLGLAAQDNWRGISFVNENLDKNKDKVLVVFDNRLYYFDIPAVFASQSPSGIFTNNKMKEPKEVYDYVKSEKITYVMVNNNWGITPNLRKDLFYPFVDQYLEPVSSVSGTIVYKVK
ncbi:MAG: hypothetical protein Q8Q24_01105 [bacterium]|nr:hypothetical protein [bacterium]